MPKKVAVVDFRNMSTQSKKKSSSTADAFYGTFIRTFASKGMPGPSEPLVWLWISGDRETELQAYALSDTLPFSEDYERYESVYSAGKYERLDDLSIKSAKSVALL